MHTPLPPGSPVPAIQLTDQSGTAISLADYLGKKIVLFFYPRDNTPTCTTEACNLRDHYQLLRDKGYEVLGVSDDGERKHKNFVNKYQLPYRLISDPNHKLIEAFGIWGEKMLFGREYMGLIRTTFIIDEKGIVKHVIHPVVAKDHTAQILALESKNN